MAHPQAWTGWWKVGWIPPSLSTASLTAPHCRVSYLRHLHPQAGADVGGQGSQGPQPL